MHFVYKIILGEEVQYVGMTTTIHARIRNHCRSKNWIGQCHKFEYVEVPNRTTAICYEMFLINALAPKYNSMDCRADDVSTMSFDIPCEAWKEIKVDVNEIRASARGKKEDIILTSYGLEMLSNLIEQHPCTCRTLMFLLKNINPHNEVSCSQKAMMEALNVSKSTISRHIRQLSNENFLKTRKQTVRNTYIINEKFITTTQENLKTSSLMK